MARKVTVKPGMAHAPLPNAQAPSQALNDGRRARSARSRDAIAHALHDLVRETGCPPSVEDIAERAGVSRRSVFRRFDDLNALYAAAHAISRIDLKARFPRPDLSAASARERVDVIARRTARIYEYAAPVIRASRQLRGEVAFVTERLATDTAELRDFLAGAFEPELAAASERDAEAALEALLVSYSWPAWEALRREQGLRVTAARAVVARLGRAVLADLANPDRP